MDSPATLFDDYFVVVEATTAEMIAAVFRLRYLVLCVEHAWLDPADYPDDMERDAYDDRALYSVLIHRRTGDVVGSVRLVLPVPGEGVDSLPITELADPAARPLLRRLIPASAAEISRYSVSKTFRRRLGEAVYADMSLVTQAERVNMERRVMPHVTLGLLRGLYNLSVRRGVTHLCAVMEPALIRLLARIGVQFEPIGPPVQFHGVRQPCYLVVDAQHDKVMRTNASFYRVIVSPAVGQK
ncbi:MAG: PEP-CTERM/exosortase system-associated acyltransferase [Rhodospirillales bacterium]|nr:MAG: PEP-CTERM/exosortase system-associated acyltransferase [Rhodospirillales bacterium]